LLVLPSFGSQLTFAFSVSPALPEQPEIKVEGPLAVGQEVKLTCEVADVYGPDAITIQWLEGERVVKEDEEPLDGEVRTVRSSLTIVPLEEDDERSFVCKATLVMEGLHGEDAQRCISSSFPLSVPCKLNCGVKFNTRDMKMKIKVKMSVSPPNSGSSTEVHNKQEEPLVELAEHCGTQMRRWRSGDETGVTKKKKKNRLCLLQKVPPKNTSIFVSPSHILKEGDMLTITCATRSNPKAAISLWRKPESGGREPLVAKAASYTLESVQMEDAGVYECEAVNRFGNVPPRNTTILVLPSAEVEEGENITISCHTIGYPRPTMTLKKMGNSASYCSSNGTFELYFLTEDDTGLYELNITNDVGYEVQTFNITPRVEGQKSPPYRAEILVPVICVSALVSIALGVLYPLLKSRLTGGYQPTLSGPQAI
uniref:Ig-like domain-containing protein n=1 Tax=Erpetoichthys calabaricus TaxID=27687 RepID=A0A8C4X852_ERPCA